MNDEQLPPPIPAIPPADGNIYREVSGPSTALLITGIIGAVLDVSLFAMQLLGRGARSFARHEFPLRLVGLFEGIGTAALCLVGLAVAAFVVYASQKMKMLEQWQLCIAASVLAMIPCISPCCIVGLPVGIWCLVVLNKPEVRAAFR